MCTVTWCRSDDAFHLFSNRDELRTRPPEAPVEITEQGGRTILSPRDTAAMGTWIAVNDHGVALTLLNGYSAADSVATPQSPTSRGQLVRDLAGAADMFEVSNRLGETDLAQFNTFVLVAISPSTPAMLFRWDGTELTITPDATDQRPVVSSSVETSDVRRMRRQAYLDAFNHREPTANELRRFHTSHDNGPSPYSVCMHRSDAATRSFTQVTVTPDEVTLHHHMASPCKAGQDVVRTLARRDVVTS